MMNRYIAAIDVGTNSVHLIIARVNPRTMELSIVDKEKEMVRLGSGSANMKFINEEAMEKAANALKRVKKICKAKRASIRAVGTSAVREAVNADFFIKKIYAETGINIEIISGFEEARLIYQGVLHAMPVYGKKILVIDVGGGSTEFLVGEKNNISYGNSLKIGTIRLWEKFFSGEKSKDKIIKKCRQFVDGMLFPVVRAVKKEKYQEVIGTSGTIINTLQMATRLRTDGKIYPVKNSFTAEELEKIAKRILAAREPRRIARIPGLDKRRADIILPGIIILEQIFKRLGINEMIVSDFALREGLIFDTVARTRRGKYYGMLADLRQKSVMSLGRTFNIEDKHASHTAKLALDIFDQLVPLHRLGPQEREYLNFAAYLHDIGLALSHSQHHIHSYYLIRNAELFGFTENEKEIIANVGRYHRKSHPKFKHPGFLNLSDSDREIVRKLASILRIADGLDRMHSSAILSVKCRIARSKVNIILSHTLEDNIDIGIWGAENKRFLFEEVFNKKVYFINKPGNN